MDEITPNQRAYLRVAEELRRTDNSLMILEKIRTLAGGINAYQVTQFRDIATEDIYMPEVTPLASLLALLGKTVDGRNTDIGNMIDKLHGRHAILLELSDIYLAGGDIVAHRLAMD